MERTIDLRVGVLPVEPAVVGQVGENPLRCLLRRFRRCRTRKENRSPHYESGQSPPSRHRSPFRTFSRSTLPPKRILCAFQRMRKGIRYDIRRRYA
jgi:hypothetical protein